MLTLAGDILNWLAAGLVFPLMLLPLAAMTNIRSPLAGTVMWAAISLAISIAGAVFVVLAPRLANNAPSAPLAALVIAAFAAFGVFIAGGPSRATKILAPILAKITRAAGRTVMWLTLTMALIQFVVVIMRYVFGISFLAMQESITYMHGAVFLIAGGYALLTNDHVRVDIFYRGASLRKRALIDFTGAYLFLFPVCLLILWSASPYVAQSWAVREGSTEQSGIQAIYLLKSFIPVFAILMAMAGFVLAARAGEVLSGGKD